MKISRVSICALFAGLFLPITSPVAHAADTDINCGTSGKYTINETGVVVSSTNCVGTVHFGSNVTSIMDKPDGQGIFQNNDSLTAVSFGPSVKSIGTNSFKGASLDSVSFSEGLETISASAFFDLNNTTQVDNVDIIFPDSLKYIGNSAFQQTTAVNGAQGKLGAISFGPNLEYLGGNAFYNSGRTGATSVTFRDEPKITSIETNVFYGNRATEFIFPSNITALGGANFSGAERLTYAVLPEGVTSVGLRAFSFVNSSSLRVVFLPDNITTLDDLAFQSQSSSTLKFVYCGSDPTLLNQINVSNYLRFFKSSSCYRAVQYNANRGSGATILETATADSNKNVAKTLRANTFTRSGYEFDGWNTKRDGSGTKYTDQQAFTQTNHLTLFAQWWDITKPRPNADNSAEERRKRQEKIDKNRLALVQKVKSGELLINPDLIDSDLPTLTVELREKANNELASQSKSIDFSFKDIQKVVAKYDLYQAIQNGLRGIVNGRAAVSASIIASSVPQKELLISKLMALDPSKRSTVEAIDKAIAEIAKIQLDRAERKAKTLEKIAKRQS